MSVTDLDALGRRLVCRAIRPLDAERLIAFDRTVMSAIGLSRPIDHPRRADLRDAVRVYAPPRAAMLVVLGNGELLAMGGFLPEPDADSTARLKRLRVAAAWRRQGIARQLVSRLEGMAADSGYRSIRLHVTARQAAALALYRARGYREVDVYPGDFGLEHLLEKPLID